MSGKLFAASFLLLLLLTSLNAHQGGDWIKVSPLGGGFSVMMPGKPEEEVKPEKDFTFHSFAVSTDKAIYIVACGDYAPSIHLDVPGELAANRENFVKDLNAKLLDSKSITMDGHPGLEFTAESDQASLKSRVYVYGNRVHQISVAVFKGKDDTENVTRFFDSFTFTKL